METELQTYGDFSPFVADFLKNRLVSIIEDPGPARQGAGLFPPPPPYWSVPSPNTMMPSMNNLSNLYSSQVSKEAVSNLYSSQASKDAMSNFYSKASLTSSSSPSTSTPSLVSSFPPLPSKPEGISNFAPVSLSRQHYPYLQANNNNV